MKCKVKRLNDGSFKLNDAAEKEAEKIEKEETDVECDFTKDEVKAIRKLLPHLDKLMVLLEIDEKGDDFEREDIGAEEDEEEEDEEIEKIDFEEEDEFVEDDDCADEKETVEDDYRKTVKREEIVKDSKKSFGAIERKKVADSDSEIDEQEEIALAFKKYYGGK